MTAMVGLALAGLIVPANAQPTHDHTSRHGGILLWAAGRTVHVEATWPMQGVVRVFVYDDVMRPLTADGLVGIRAQVAIGSEVHTLQPSTGGFLEAAIPSLTAPAQMTLRFARPPAGEEQIPLTFDGHSEENQAFSFMLPPTPIPGTLAGVLEALRGDARDARASVENTASIFAYAPAVRARDHLMALERYLPALAPAARPRAEATILAGVRAAWLLHTAADSGISPWQITGSVDILSEALDDVISAFGGPSR
jgi:hypothetical protein